jgi:hypothetical protein
MELLTGLLLLLATTAAGWLLVKVLHARRRFQRRIIDGERHNGRD